jgi:hypothetical protein
MRKFWRGEKKFNSGDDVNDGKRNYRVEKEAQEGAYWVIRNGKRVSIPKYHDQLSSGKLPDNVDIPGG